MKHTRTVSFANLVVALNCALAPVVFAATPPKGKFTYTYPQPPRPRPNDPMRVAAGSEVPQNPERYVWKIKARGKAAAAGTVKTYNINFDGRGSVVGTVPEGTEIKLDLFRQSAGQIYYAMLIEGKQVWVSGHDVTATAYTPPAN